MRGFRADHLFDKRTTAQSAVLALGSGANGTVTITVTAAGSAGNAYSCEVVAGEGEDSALSAALDGTAITVTLGTDELEAPDDAKNTAELVAAAIDALDGVTAADSGNGTGVIPVTALTHFSVGHDILTPFALAKLANVTDEMIVNLEHGGNCEVYEAQRIADALGIALSDLGVGV